MNPSSSQYGRANYGYLVFGNIDYPGTEGGELMLEKWYLSIITIGRNIVFESDY